MIYVGTDIEEVARFQNADTAFLELVFDARELEYARSVGNAPQHLCARWCAKEAAIKALSRTKYNKLRHRDFVVLNDENGAPYFAENPAGADFDIVLSISHTKTFATAVVVIQDKK
jgi:phosphopantetheine--protein transferase-like protein